MTREFAVKYPIASSVLLLLIFGAIPVFLIWREIEPLRAYWHTVGVNRQGTDANGIIVSISVNVNHSNGRKGHPNLWQQYPYVIVRFADQAKCETLPKIDPMVFKLEPPNARELLQDNRTSPLSPQFKECPEIFSDAFFPTKLAFDMRFRQYLILPIKVVERDRFRSAAINVEAVGYKRTAIPNLAEILPILLAAILPAVLGLWGLIVHLNNRIQYDRIVRSGSDSDAVLVSYTRSSHPYNDDLEVTYAFYDANNAEYRVTEKRIPAGLAESYLAILETERPWLPVRYDSAKPSNARINRAELLRRIRAVRRERRSSPFNLEP